MSESEKFLDRWSRLKREAADDVAHEAESKGGKIAATRPVTVKDLVADEPFDIASLPAIDSIGAHTDIRGFMQAGVPAELKNAALRRAWSVDPQIRDFIGLVENGWDFNDPNAMHGFGPIDPREVESLLAKVIGPPAKPAHETEVAAQKDPEMKPDSAFAHPGPERQAGTTSNEGTPDETSMQHSEENVAAQNETGASPQLTK